MAAVPPEPYNLTFRFKRPLARSNRPVLSYTERIAIVRFRIILRANTNFRRSSWIRDRRRILPRSSQSWLRRHRRQFTCRGSRCSTHFQGNTIEESWVRLSFVWRRGWCDVLMWVIQPIVDVWRVLCTHIVIRHNFFTVPAAACQVQILHDESLVQIRIHLQSADVIAPPPQL